jgi:hypothetical protein
LLSGESLIRYNTFGVGNFVAMRFLASIHVRSLEQWIKVVTFANDNCITLTIDVDEKTEYENLLALAYVKGEITLKQFDSYIPLAEGNTPLDILRAAACNLESSLSGESSDLALIKKALASKAMAPYYKGRN